MLCESKGNLESSFELTYQTKRQLTLIGIALRRFAAGIDYIIILPSVYFYLQSFGSSYYFLGLVIAADSLVSFVLSPLIEKLGEKWQRVRFLGFLANLFQIAGSLIYAVPLYFYMPLIGRLVSGLGQSFGGALYGEVKRVTSPEERNRVMIFMEGVRLLGVVIGPGMNFFLKDFDLTFGPWLIDQRTAPGFFMAIVWLLVEVVHVFTVFDLSLHQHAYKEIPDCEISEDDQIPYNKKPNIDQPSTVHSEPKSDKDEPKTDEPTTDTSESETEDMPTEKIQVVETDEELSHGKDKSVRPVTGSSYTTPTKLSRPGSRTSYVRSQPEAMPHSIRDLLCRSDVMLILICQFLMFFNETAFETLMLLVGVNQLGFTISILSTIFICAGIEMVTVIVVVWSANKALDAKYLLITSLSAGILASFARLAVGFADDNSIGCIVMTILMGVFTILGTPISSIAGKSLLPKLTLPETHAFYQSAFATSQHLGLVTGSLIASVLYTHLILFSSLAIGVFLVVYMMLLPTVEKMKFAAHSCGS